MHLCHGDRSGAGWSDHDQFGQVGALCAWQYWLSGCLWRARGLHRLRFGGPYRARLRVKREGRAYAAGSAGGLALVLREPLSLFGGIAVETGEIIDNAHPDRGKTVSGRILVAAGGRGSSSSSAVLAEAIRLDTAPAGIVLAHV